MECSGYVFKFNEFTYAREQTLHANLQHIKQCLAYSRCSINIYYWQVQTIALEMLAVKLPQTNLEICFRNRTTCCTTDLYKFLHSRKKMLPLNCNLSTISLGVRRETTCSGIINYLGNKDSRKVPFIQQIFTKL